MMKQNSHLTLPILAGVCAFLSSCASPEMRSLVAVEKSLHLPAATERKQVDKGLHREWPKLNYTYEREIRSEFADTGQVAEARQGIKDAGWVLAERYERADGGISETYTHADQPKVQVQLFADKQGGGSILIAHLQE